MKATSIKTVPLPSLDHLTSDDYQKVYQPSEDTFFFMDAIGCEREFIQGIHPKICLEIG